MTIDLEERIRRAAQLLDDEATRACDTLILVGAGSRQAGARRSVVVSVAAVCMLLVGLFGVYLIAGRNPASAPATSEMPSDEGPPATSAATSLPVVSVPVTRPPGWVAPAATLPALTDVSSVVPPTVLGTGPTDWYRLQPDLDVAWYSDGGDHSMLCFRTPAGQDCQLDRFAPTASGGGPIGVRSVDDQLLVLTLDPASTVTVTFDIGHTVTRPVEADEQIGWAVARVQMPPAGTPEGLSMLFGTSQGGSASSAPPMTTLPTSEPVPSIAG